MIAGRSAELHFQDKKELQMLEMQMEKAQKRECEWKFGQHTNFPDP